MHEEVPYTGIIIDNHSGHILIFICIIIDNIAWFLSLNTYFNCALFYFLSA